MVQICMIYKYTKFDHGVGFFFFFDPWWSQQMSTVVVLSHKLLLNFVKLTFYSYLLLIQFIISLYLQTLLYRLRTVRLQWIQFLPPKPSKWRLQPPVSRWRTVQRDAAQTRLGTEVCSMTSKIAVSSSSFFLIYLLIINNINSQNLLKGTASWKMNLPYILQIVIVIKTKTVDQN